MSTFTYAYTRSNGTGKAARGIHTLTGAVRHLQRSLAANEDITKEQAKQVAHVAAHKLGDVIKEHGITVRITKEEA